MAIRVSRQHVEVLALGTPNLRVSRQYVEVLALGIPLLRISRQHVEALGAGTPGLRISRQHVEALCFDTPFLRVSRQYVEALCFDTPFLRASRQHVEALGAGTPGLRISRQHIELLTYTPHIHVTRQHVEVLGYENPNLRVSRQHVEALCFDIPYLRVSRQHIEALGPGTPGLHVSRQYIEVLGSGIPNLRVSRQHVEILSLAAILEVFASSTIRLRQTITVAPRGIAYEYYGTIQEANAYFAAQLHEKAWSQSRVINRPKALWAATIIIDSLNYKGYKHSVYELQDATPAEIHAAEVSQVLEFPRDADTEVPEEIQKAVYEIAYDLLDGKDPELELENLGIISQGYASVRTSYSRTQVPIEHIINGVPTPQAWRWLKPFLRDDDAIKLTRIS